MIDRIRRGFRDHEVNLVLARGSSLAALTAGLRAQRREPLSLGETDGWAWGVHEMVTAETDGQEVDYRRICADGSELVVFVTEPCSVKAHAPRVMYFRDGRCILTFSLEDIEQRAGDNPDHLSPELLAAGLIGPDAYCDEDEADDGHDCFDHCADDRARIVQVVVDFFGLPEVVAP
ncbi:hypothetical protein [Streptomyces bambusae]|uniref:Uncharacterized protein n=1 Tax=Streptomyces bambusae TaxID=1550616 RepID=A0ABS6Z4M1_9ACTN|nr:hypothetical protein [Streptomyces bambusae]MBW5482178.1 hypothetical protein [Streptomyces bambusae]